jgi:hypothetical protein
MVRKLLILVSLVTFSMVAVADSVPRGKPRQREGDYNLTVGGDYVGQGTSVVGGDRVKLTANVKGPAGSSILNANCTINGTHFSGTGNVNGNAAVFKGRLDAPDDDQERAIKGVRLVCTFTVTGDGVEKTYGRIVGYIPAQAAAEDDDRDRGRNIKK